MIETITEHMMRLTEPMLQRLKVDFVYFFEDCCGSSGPLFSPASYRAIFDRHYRDLIGFYKAHGVPLALVDSDGFTEPLIPCWLESGFDILFPIEVGKWGANAAALRQKFGPTLRMLGGVNKHLLGGGEAALRQHLLAMKPEVDRGGFLPIPDHRVPPEVSYPQMQRYIEIFREVFTFGGP
jgi:uroporphyrinogen decarboxylase